MQTVPIKEREKEKIILAVLLSISTIVTKKNVAHAAQIYLQGDSGEQTHLHQLTGSININILI